MRRHFFINPNAINRGRMVCLIVALFGSMARAQQAAPTPNSASESWQLDDWLKPSEDRQRQAASGTSTTVTKGQNVSDPFAVITTGSLWQEKYGALYTQRLADTLALSYETSSITLNAQSPLLGDSSSDDLSQEQKVGLQFQPVEELTLRGNVHDSTNDPSLTDSATVTSGAGFSAESRLPFNSVLTLAVNSDRTGTDLLATSTAHDTGYDAQLQKPLGKIPLTAVFKSHYDTTTDDGATTHLPSMEQSLVWKPAPEMTVQMGLRQQQYQDFPGLPNQYNQALFADWSQRVLPEVVWHSSAEVLNSRGIQDTAPAVPIASGANGTPQATTPNPGLNSVVPISVDNETLTFSTGPSFQLQKDISASIQYSNRWDQTPVPGNVGQEQRVSVSLKGTF